MPPRILVVDDDGPVRKALGRLFRGAGYEVELFTSAEEYLTREPAAPPACLVLDMRMPGMGGLELQRVIGGTAKALPIVFVTGHLDEEARAQALAGGAIAVLQKPLDEEMLLGAIKSALGPPGA
jgi:FixJ family two-component response regulator